MFLPLGHVVLGKDGLGRTFGHAQGTVDALLWIDDKEIRPFVETIHGADIDAIGVFALDAGFGDNVSHGGAPGTRNNLPLPHQNGTWTTFAMMGFFC
jgi:hypothetical protein